MMKKIAISLALLTAGLVLFGCATPQSKELRMAQQSFAAAKDDASVSQDASVTLYEARQALDKAQQADSLPEQKHYAYLAQKKIDLARVQADQAEINQEVAKLQERQDDFLLRLKERQVDQARQEAAQSQRQLRAYRSQKQQAELERARQEARTAQTELQQLRNELKDMKSRESNAGVVVTLPGVVFDFDKANLKTGAERGLQRVSDFLESHPERNIIVEGFTDNRGSEQYNRALSEERARAVARALQSDGVPEDRITVRGLGEKYPVATNGTAAGRLQNRRVEITILNPGTSPQDAGR